MGLITATALGASAVAPSVWAAPALASVPPAAAREERGGAWPGRPSAVFLDRDGVINENRADHVKSWSEFRFLPGAVEAIAQLTRAGLPVFVISNQAIVNRGTVAPEVVDDIHQRMTKEIERGGGCLQAVACCPHRPDEQCRCRKPRPGLLLELAGRFSVDLRRAVVIGDALTDIEAGQAAGCETVLVQTGRGTDQARLAGGLRRDFLVLADLRAAVIHVLRRAASAIPVGLAG